MKKTKKIAFTATIPFFILLLSGCGAQKQISQPIAPVSTTTMPQVPNNATASRLQQTTNGAAEIAAKQQASLPTLPTDDKAAIDSELNNIDKELKTTDNLINSDDLSNAGLGL